MEKTDVVTVSSKGQVVIPQNVRHKLGISVKSKLLVYPYQDTLIMKKLDTKNVEKRLEQMYRRIDARKAKYGGLTEEEIREEIEKFRLNKRKEKRG
ncbi:MAG: AbrB/MazE/SpoVT family DNA-binding domain-containing protein [Nitrososphaerales archaeon]